MNECRQNSPIHQSFTVTLRLNFLPVKMQEHGIILRVITDVLVTDVTGNVVTDVFDDFTPSCQAHGKGRRESQTCKGGFLPPRSRHISPLQFTCWRCRTSPQIKTESFKMLSSDSKGEDP